MSATPTVGTTVKCPDCGRPLAWRFVRGRAWPTPTASCPSCKTPEAILARLLTPSLLRRLTSVVRKRVSWQLLLPLFLLLALWFLPDLLKWLLE